MIFGIREYGYHQAVNNWPPKDEFFKFTQQSDLYLKMQEIATFDPIYHPSIYNYVKHNFPGLELINENFSQSWQDIFVLSMLNGKRHGTYLELGASNACYNNNTFLLEQQFQWRGVSLDFRGEIVDEWQRLRPNAKLVIDDALSLDFEKLLIDNQLPTRIDYLQVDLDSTCDATLQALMRLPHNKYRFSVITFETDIFEGYKAAKDSARKLLEDLGYMLLIDNVAVKNYPTKTWEPFEDWYIDPGAIDIELIQKFKQDNGTTKLPHKIFIRDSI